MGYQRERERQRDRDRDRDRDRQKYSHRHSRDHDRHHRRRSDSRSDSQRRPRHSHYDYEHSRPREDRYHRRSRSRSPDKRNDQEWKQEERDQKIRLAIRNSTINYDMNIHEQYMKLPEAKKQELAEQAHSPEHIQECILVRELYVSGMYDANEATIRDFFSRYGQIQSVEIIKNFIFVKYFKVEDASNACADYHNINTTLHHNNHNSNFKIFFADHLKRFNVVSNNPAYEVKEYLIPVVYASVRNDPDYYANEQYLNGLFSRYGFIRNLEVKRNQLPTQRTYVLVEYQTIGQAMRAKEKMKVQRDKLGDRKSEITLLIDNQKITRKYPNINNQIRYQRKRQSNITQMSTAGNITNNINNQNPNQPQQQPPNQVTQPQEYNYNMGHHNPPQNYSDSRNQTFDLQGIMGILNQHAGNAEMEEEHHVADWSGFINRHKSHKVGVDFIRIHPEPVELDQFNLQILYRADLRQALDSQRYNFAGKFKASQASQQQVFKKHYVDYFSRKKRAGILMTNKYLIYLLPPLPELNIEYPVEQDQLLALFFQLP